ncbi:hypothetical protein B0T17DRAFT_545786 [Bombardia bombarda]|uniref:ZZ-type domain-containing protein n=1 Tax=Bombardia bombarda TaxID=252184 RepID=A0AA39W9Q9_9PEZI|nr:hypothetical protein B0T17DRAFT_545786 [Bombardia bombarda]
MQLRRTRASNNHIVFSSSTSITMAPEGQSDIGALWAAALADYENTADIRLATRPESKFTVEQIIRAQGEELQHFYDYRHRGKLDKIRTFIRDNGGIIQSIAENVATSASAAFPPSTAILTAFTCVLTAAKKVSEDFDVIESFFELMHTFMRRMSLLEGKLPTESQYQEALINVFAAILRICAIAQSYCTKPLGRLKKWAKALYQGNDEELQTAYKKLNDNLSYLESTTIIQTLKYAVENAQDSMLTHGKLDSISGQLSTNIALTYQLQGNMQETLTYGRTSVEILQRLVSNQASQRSRPDGKQQSQGKQNSQAKDSGAVKSQAIDMVRQRFGSPSHASLKIRQRQLKEAFIQGTFDWIQQDQGYQSVLDRTTHCLWISGSTGMGKSSLSYSIFERLLVDLNFEDQASVGVYFFDSLGQEEDLENMYFSVAIQIAEQNAAYCNEIKRITFPPGELDTSDKKWEGLFTSKFANPKRHVVIILDSVDQLDESDQLELIGRIREAVTKALNIRFIFTSNQSPEIEKSLGDLSFNKLNLSLDKIRHDLKIFTRSRMKELPELRNIRRRGLRRKVAASLVAKADSFLYIEYMLLRLNRLRKEQLISNELDDLPQNTTKIYEALYNECLKYCSKGEKEMLRNLFTWLAYSKSYLNLSDAKDLLRLTGNGKDAINIDEELDGRLSNLLRFSAVNTTSQEDDSGTEDTTGLSDDIEATSDSTMDKNRPRQILDGLLAFRESAMRNYLHDVVLEDKNNPTPAQVMMFKMICNILVHQETKEGDEMANIAQYAGRKWLSHLLEIDISRTTDEEKRTVLEGLFSICQNENRCLRCIEYSAFASPEDEKDSASIFETGDIDFEKSMAIFNAWIEVGSRIPPDVLSDSTIVDWIHTVLEDDGHVLIKLARGHVSNWFVASTPQEAYLSFRFAHRSFALAHQKEFQLRRNHVIFDYFENDYKENETIKDKAFHAVAEAFWEIGQSAQTFRRVALALRYSSYYLEALVQAKRGLSLAKDAKTRFDIYYDIGSTAYSFTEDTNFTSDDPTAKDAKEDKPLDTEEKRKSMLQESISSFDEAIKLKDAVSNNPSILNELYLTKAKILIQLGMAEQAMESIEEASKLDSFRIQPQFLWSLIRELGKAAEWEYILRTLSHANAEDLGSYLNYWTGDIDEGYIQQAGIKLEKQDLITAFYQKAIQWTDKERDAFQWSRFTLAKFHFRVLNDAATAKQLIQQAMDKTRGYSYWMISTASWELSTILLEDFRTLDVEGKMEAWKEMKRLLERLKETQDESFDPSMSQTAVPMAIMMRKMGPADEFHSMAMLTFRHCMDLLTDNKHGNDQSSFRMLAKVLSLLPGLKRDAEIASSCQLYIVDMAVFNNEKAITDSLPDNNTPGQKPNDDIEASKSSPTPDTSDIQSDAAPSVLSDFKESKANDGTEALGSLPAPDTSKAHSDDKPSAAEDSKESKEFDLNDDDSYTTCNGCEKIISSWESGPFYLCYYCPDVDLCEECYTNKIETENGTAAKPNWRVICPKGHKHIKAPVEGWKGIKDGVMVFEDATKNQGVAAWLQELEFKWTAAWDRFWAE